MVSVGREDIGENGEMRDDFASGQNSVGFEVEPVPITQELEPSINDSVSAIISFGLMIKIYLLHPINRTIKPLNAAVKMKAS